MLEFVGKKLKNVEICWKGWNMLERLKYVGEFWNMLEFVGKKLKNVEIFWKGWNMLERLKYVGKVEVCWSENMQLWPDLLTWKDFISRKVEFSVTIEFIFPICPIDFFEFGGVICQHCTFDVIACSESINCDITSSRVYNAAHNSLQMSSF